MKTCLNCFNCKTKEIRLGKDIMASPVWCDKGHWLYSSHYATSAGNYYYYKDLEVLEQAIHDNRPPRRIQQAESCPDYTV